MKTNKQRKPKLPRPAPEEVVARRKACGLTQEQAGAILDADGRGWRAYELGGRSMHPVFWKFFLRETEALMKPGES